MSWNVVHLDQVAATPWRNGGGVTRELLAWPGADDWRVRMSVAEVAQDGPFSRFAGVQRWFTVLAGAGVRLRLEGATHALTGDSAPLGFDGDAATDCELIAGPTQDFNLMLRGSEGRMGRVRGRQAMDGGAGKLIGIYNRDGEALILSGNGETEIDPRTLAWRILETDTALRVDAQDALWMEITP